MQTPEKITPYCQNSVGPKLPNKLKPFRPFHKMLVIWAWEIQSTLYNNSSETGHQRQRMTSWSSDFGYKIANGFILRSYRITSLQYIKCKSIYFLIINIKINIWFGLSQLLPSNACDWWVFPCTCKILYNNVWPTN